MISFACSYMYSADEQTSAEIFRDLAGKSFIKNLISKFSENRDQCDRLFDNGQMFNGFALGQVKKCVQSELLNDDYEKQGYD